MPAIKWNSADKTADMSLANGDLDAINLGNATHEGVRANVGRSDGSYVVEFKIIATRTPSDIYIGIGNSSLLLNNSPPGNAHAHVLWRGGGSVEIQGVNVGTLAFDTGDTCLIAIKPALGRIWISKTAGATWLGGGNPGSNTTPTGTYTNTGTLAYPFHITDNAPTGSYDVRVLGDVSNLESVPPTGFSPFGDSGEVDVFRGALQTKWEKAKAGLDWALSSPLALLSAPVGTPLRPFEWPVPRGYQRAVNDWAAPPSLALLSAPIGVPLLPLEFVVPRGAVFPIGMRSWAINLQQTTLRADFSMCSGYPNASDVRDGVQYGPNGNDYTGTLTGGAGGGWILRRR